MRDARRRCGPRQLALALDHAESFAREDFLAGPSNAAALALIERWPDWPDRAVVAGRPGRLGQKPSRRDLGERSPAPACSPRARWRRRDLPAALATGALVVEDLARRRLRRARAVSSAQSRARGASLSCCSPRARRPAAGASPIRDLGSRLACAAGRRRSSAPDDALLRAVIVKLFADRQLLVDESLVSYVATRIERSFAAARAAVARPRSRGDAPQRPLTRTLAAEFLRSRNA